MKVVPTLSPISSSTVSSCNPYSLNHSWTWSVPQPLTRILPHCCHWIFKPISVPVASSMPSVPPAYHLRRRRRRLRSRRGRFIPQRRRRRRSICQIYVMARCREKQTRAAIGRCLNSERNIVAFEMVIALWPSASGYLRSLAAGVGSGGDRCFKYFLKVDISQLGDDASYHTAAEVYRI